MSMERVGLAVTKAKTMLQLADFVSQLVSKQATIA